MCEQIQHRTAITLHYVYTYNVLAWKDIAMTKITFAKKCENGFNNPVVLTETASTRKQRVVGIESEHFDAPRTRMCLSKKSMREMIRSQGTIVWRSARGGMCDTTCSKG
jgi:hypothetical protein